MSVKTSSIEHSSRLSTGQFVGLVLLGLLLSVLVLLADEMGVDGIARLLVAASVGAAFAALLFVYPRVGLTIGIVYIYGSFSFFLKIPVSHVVVFLASFGALFRIVSGESIRQRDAMFNWALAIFLMLAVQSVLFAKFPAHSAIGFAKLGKAIVVVYLIVQLTKTFRDLEQLTIAMYIGTLASILFGAFFFLTGRIVDIKVAGVEEVIRFTGTHSNPNNAALYFISTVPIAFYWLKRANGLLLRLLAILALVSIVLAVVATFSRQAVFAFSFVSVAILLKETRSIKAYMAVGAVALGILVLAPQSYWHRLMSIGQLLAVYSGDWSFYLRVKAMTAAWHLFLANPFTGIGINNFVKAGGSEMFVRLNTHSTYLEILVGTGLFGLAAFLGIHLASIRAGVKTLVTWWREPRMNDLVYYVLVSYCGVLLGSVFQSIPFNYVIWVPSALALAAFRISRGEPK